MGVRGLRVLTLPKNIELSFRITKSFFLIESPEKWKEVFKLLNNYTRNLS
jgi:hypothetical protein